MRSFLRTVSLLVIVVLPSFSIAQTIDSNYEVAKWPGFTEAAITYTFDDNCSNQYAIAIPQLDEFGFTGTFFPVGNWGPNWSKFKEAVATGHEIGSHTVSHPDLSKLNLEAQEAELKNSKEKIDAEIGESACQTIAYPYCVPSNAALTNKYYFAARHCQGQINKTTPTDFMNISSIICGELGSLKTVDNFKSNFESTAKIAGWSVYLIHGIDGDGGYSSLKSEVLHSSLEFLDQNRERFWVATFGNAVRYIRERNNVSVTETEATDEKLTVAITDTLNNDVYNLPVTLRRQLPDGWGKAYVLQGAYTLLSNIVTINDLKYVEFDVVPDVASVQIVKVDQTSSSLMRSNSSVKIAPNPFEKEIQIKANGNFEYQLYSIAGKLIDSGNCNDSKLIGQTLNSGMYMLNVKDADGKVSQKIIKL